MGSDPGSDIPNQDKSFFPKENTSPKKQTEGVRCNICGLVARNVIELDEHVKHAHRQRDSENAENVYSDEQKIDPFVKTKD
jgi:hypothetical protein